MSFIGTKDFPRSIQLDNYSCGARSVYVLLEHFDRPRTYAWVKKATRLTSDGVYVKYLISSLRSQGIRVGYRGETMSFGQLKDTLQKGGVVLAHVDSDHFIVVHGYDGKRVWIADPSAFRCIGRTETKKTFRWRWGNWGLAIFPPKNPLVQRAA
jgi:ABC-type bacteriocin/lantibiotic exporter with double-glycine peptidase domain